MGVEVTIGSAAAISKVAISNGDCITIVWVEAVPTVMLRGRSVKGVEVAIPRLAAKLKTAPSLCSCVQHYVVERLFEEENR